MTDNTSNTAADTAIHDCGLSTQAVAWAQRQPWQMTRDELNVSLSRDVPRPLLPAVRYGDKVYRGESFSDLHPAILGRVEELGREGITSSEHEAQLSYGFILPGGEFAAMDPKTRNIPPTAHRAAVETALAECRPVPAEVLADYPDLAQQVQSPACTPADLMAR